MKITSTLLALIVAGLMISSCTAGCPSGLDGLACTLDHVFDMH